MRLIGLAAMLLIALWAQAAYAQEPFPEDMTRDGFTFGLYLLASLIVFFELFDFLLRLYLRHSQTSPRTGLSVAPTSTPLDIGHFSPYQQRLHLRPYAVILSVHNLGEEVHRFIENIALYRDHLWVVDDASTDDTCRQLQRAGIRCISNLSNGLKPGAIKILLNHLPADVHTVLVLDPDTEILDSGRHNLSDLEIVIFEFQRSGMAAVCPRVAVRRDGWLASLQQLEYWLAFGLGRKSLGDHSITSGIALYRKDVLHRLLATHSLSVYAEDLENTLRILAEGGRIYYDGRLVVETEGKRDWRSWFSQRVGWSYGLIKVYTEHFNEIWRFSRQEFMSFYQYIIYMGGFALVLHPVKLVSAAILVASAANGLDALLGLGWVPDTAYTSVWYFLLAYSKYTVLMLFILPLSVGRGERLRQIPAALVYFFYALVHLIPVTVGYLNWLSLRLLGRRLYRDHYAKDTHINGRLGRNG